MSTKKREMKKELYNTKEAAAAGEVEALDKDKKVRGITEVARESTAPEAADIPTAEDIADFTPAMPSAMDEAEAAALSPIDAEVVTALVPKPKKDYAVAGAGMYADIAGNTPALVMSDEGKRAFGQYVAKWANKIEAKNVLFGLNEKGEIYNTLTAYEKAFIIALRVLLSDSTADRHALIEAKRKEKGKEYAGDIKAYEGIDFFGACNIRPEAYARFRYDTARSDKEKAIYAAYKDYPVNPKEAALLRLGFTDRDIVVIIDRGTFIRDYLGGKKGGTQSQAFTEALTRLRTGRVAFTTATASSSKEGIKLITDNLIRRTATFFGDKNGQRVEYYAISLHPAFARIFTPNYITYPANNSEVLGAILQVRKGADGLLALYDTILQRAARNYEAIDKRPGIQVFTLKEAEILPLIATDKQYKKNKKEVVARLYSDTGINLFYTVGLLADRVAPPTEEARKKAAAAGKDVEIEVHFRRVAATNCTQ